MKRRSSVVATLLAAAMVITAIPAVQVDATETATGSVPAGYSLKWADEFDGNSLNRDMWNVELHDAGWVNSELQAYVDSEENIKVSDGTLKLIPKKTTETVIVSQPSGNLLKNAAFTSGKDNWTETIANWGSDGATANASSTTANGAITYTINSPGNADWHVQLKQSGVSLENGKTYQVSYKVTSSVARQIKSGVMSTKYAWYGGSDPVLAADVITPVSFEFTMSVDDSAADFYISLGKIEGVDTPAGTITISDLVLKEKKAAATPTNLIAGNDFCGALSNGAITAEVTNANMGSNVWDLQKIAYGVSLEEGATYVVSYEAASTVERSIVAGVQETSDPWGQYAQDFPTLTTEMTAYSYSFVAKASDSNAGLYFNIGKNGDNTPESTITIQNISLVKQTNENNSQEDSIVTKEVTTYTSGRISTQNKETFTYGYFECRAKVPAGQGYLPAFWLMANDENVYGQWPRCGEIDCMEVMGQDTTKVYGTIHYGNPHAESQGTNVNTENSYSNDFHTYACEWEPGKITWYVDGVKYHEESDWYSTTEGQGTLTYPAPFDQPFYVILNLAVGGSWVGNPDDSTTYGEASAYEIDYVRVYQKDGYDENVTRPEKTVTLRQPNADGNYINNGTFDASEDLSDDVDWKFLTALEGVGTASIENGQMVIRTDNFGTADYSIQLVQANLPFEKGAQYEVSFDAYATADRTMNVDIKAPDHGYSKYMNTLQPALTTNKQTFTTTFTMASDTDANGRLEFNMGAMDSTATIYIDNVVVKKIADPNPEELAKKTVLSDGNYVYNGGFDQGTGHLGDWVLTTKGNATYGVTNWTSGRRFQLIANTGTAGARLTQTDLTFAPNTTYEFKFNTLASVDSRAKVIIGGKKYMLDIPASAEKVAHTITLNAASYENQNLQIFLETTGTVSIDDVKLMDASPLKNGSFTDGLTGYEVYVDGSASASADVKDEQLVVTVNNTSDADWKIQVKQNNLTLEQGHTYALSFDAKSSIDRKIRVIMQGGEAKGWPVYSATAESGDGIVALNSEYQTFTTTFTMGAASDTAAFLSMCLAAVDETAITDKHTISIDNILFYEVVEEGSDNTESIYTPEVTGTDMEDGFDPKPAVVHDNKNVTVTKEEGTPAVVVKKDKENPSVNAPGQAKKTAKNNSKKNKVTVAEETPAEEAVVATPVTDEQPALAANDANESSTEVETAAIDDAPTAKAASKKLVLPIVFVSILAFIGMAASAVIFNKKTTK